MISCYVNEPILFQYAAVIPYGETVTNWIAKADNISKLMDCDMVSIIGKNGNLKSLNITGTIVYENIRENKTGEEILEYLFSNFAKSKNMAEKIAEDYVEFVNQMIQLGYVKPNYL